MAKTLSVQELATTNELSTSQELGQLRKISTMQDIPLAETDATKDLTKIGEETDESSQQYLDAEAERKLKTGSLRRFFRLSPKKHGDTLETKKTGRKNEEQNDKARGGAEKPKIRDSAHSNVDLSGAASKSTLKTSFSTYWNSVNSVFKTKKSKRSAKTSSVVQSEDEETVINTENLDNTATHDNLGDGANITEDIHALKISDECNSPK